MPSLRQLVLHRLGARVLADELAARRVTSEAVIRDCLERIASREETVRAWSFLDPELAIRQAQDIDRGPYRGTLHGVPVAIKDIIDTYDMPTEYGSSIYAGFRPGADAGCVAMSRSAGAVIMGKTVTTEFAASHPGKTTHPLNPNHTPGGSSSGSAASVADFMVPLALGTQTGGSVIRPASFCGIVGFKPSFGFINRSGVKQISDSLDTVGIFARSVADCAFFLSAISGAFDYREIDARRPVRVGLCETPSGEQASAESRAALHQAADALRADGLAVVEFRLPEPFARLPDAHHTVDYFEMARSLQHEYRKHRERLSPALLSRIQRGLDCRPVEYESALKLADECRDTIDALLSSVDLVITPSAAGEAPAGLASTGSSTFNRTWTLLGVPCLTLPVARGTQNLPIGIQLIGRSRRDAQLLCAGLWIERALPQLADCKEIA